MEFSKYPDSVQERFNSEGSGFLNPAHSKEGSFFRSNTGSWQVSGR